MNVFPTKEHIIRQDGPAVDAVFITRLHLTRTLTGDEYFASGSTHVTPSFSRTDAPRLPGGHVPSEVKLICHHNFKNGGTVVGIAGRIHGSVTEFEMIKVGVTNVGYLFLI